MAQEEGFLFIELYSFRLDMFKESTENKTSNLAIKNKKENKK